MSPISSKLVANILYHFWTVRPGMGYRGQLDKLVSVLKEINTRVKDSVR